MGNFLSPEIRARRAVKEWESDKQVAIAEEYLQQLLLLVGRILAAEDLDHYQVDQPAEKTDGVDKQPELSAEELLFLTKLTETYPALAETILAFFGNLTAE